MNIPNAITRDQVLGLLRAERDRVGSVAKMAASRRISASGLSMTLAGDRPLADTAAIAAGYMPMTIYVPVRRGG